MSRGLGGAATQGGGGGGGGVGGGGARQPPSSYRRLATGPTDAAAAAPCAYVVLQRERKEHFAPSRIAAAGWLPASRLVHVVWPVTSAAFGRLLRRCPLWQRCGDHSRWLESQAQLEIAQRPRSAPATREFHESCSFRVSEGFFGVCVKILNSHARKIYETVQVFSAVKLNLS